MHNKNNNTIRNNGIILLLIGVALSVMFTIRSTWNVATVLVVVLILLIAVLQFFIHYKFMADEKNPATKKQIETKKRNSLDKH